MSSPMRLYKHGRPSIEGGFARERAEAAHPDLWDGLLVAYEPVLGMTGDVFFDYANVRHINGTVESYDPTLWLHSEFGWRLQLDGGADFIDLGDNFGIASTDGITVICWVRAATPHNMRLVQKRGTGGFGAQEGWQFSWVNTVSWGNTAIEDSAGNFTRINSGQNFTWADGEWHQLVMRYDRPADLISIYKDGLDQNLAQTAGTPGASNGSRNCTIGCAWNDVSTQSQFFDGDVADIRIYDRAVDPAALHRDYNLGPAAPFIIGDHYGSLSLHAAETALAGAGTILPFMQQGDHYRGGITV